MLPSPGLPCWTFNGNEDKPTVTPSILTTWAGGYGPKHEHRRCHLHLKDGMLKFLGDSTHHLKGKQVPLPDIPSDAL